MAVTTCSKMRALLTSLLQAVSSFAPDGIAMLASHKDWVVGPFPRVPTARKSHGKAMTFYFHFPGLEQSWNFVKVIESCGKVIEY